MDIHVDFNLDASELVPEREFAISLPRDLESCMN